MSRVYDLADLDELEGRCREVVEKMGLEVPEILFHFAPAEHVYDIASRGLPGRYSHWRFGRDYERMKLDHDFGRSRIYELVLNTEPYQAYLLQGNSWVAQLLVVAHVYGHCWFFSNNRYFDRADKKFLHRVRAGADRIETYARRFGSSEVEDFIDAVQAVAVHRPFDVAGAPESIDRPPHDPYADLFPDETAAQQARREAERRQRAARFPHEPEEDLLGFVLNHAPRLEDWQRDVISIVRDEAGYFDPQRRTKIANEGFAVWLHNRIVHTLQLETEDFVEFEKLNSAVVSPHSHSLNPYNLGFELWREVERIYDGPAPDERERYGGAGEVSGFDRVCELASGCDDSALVDQFLNANVAERCRLQAWRREGPNTRVSSDEADLIRDLLVRDIRTLGIPKLVITDADAFHRGGLWLEHRHEGVGLDSEYALMTLPLVAALWGRSVYIESIATHEGATRPVWFACDPGEPHGRVVTERPA